MPRGRPATCKLPYKDGDKELKCQLPTGHPGRHGPRPVVVIPKDQFILEDVGDDERGNVRRKRVERSEQQLMVDQMVMNQWRIWVEFGNDATTWAKIPLKEFMLDGKPVRVVRRWKIDKTLEETAIRMLHNAANHEGKKVVIGDVDRETVPGKSRIPFFVVTRPEGEEAPATAIPEPSAQTPAVPAGSQT